MKIVSVAEFLQSVQLGQAFTSRASMVPALQYLYFQDSTIRAFSGEVGSIGRCPWQVDQPFAVSAELLLRLLTSLQAQGVQGVEVKRTEHTLGLKAAGFTGRLPLLDETERSSFILRDPPGASFHVATDPLLWAAMELAGFSVSQDSSKPMLQGVYWTPSGSLLSTDSFRVTAVYPDAKARGVPPGGAPLLCPDHLLQRLGERRKSVRALALEGGILWCFLEGGDAVYGALLNAEFPISPLVALIKRCREGQQQSGTSVRVTDPLGSVEHALSRLLFFAPPPMLRVEVKVEKDGLVLSAGSGTSAAQEHLGAEVNGGTGAVVVNGAYLKDALLRVGTSFWTHIEDITTPLYIVSESRQVEHIVLRLAE